MLEEGSTAYMRPLPGAARMYPETDIFPVTIDSALWEAIPLPELLTAKAERFGRELGLDPASAYQAAVSENLPVFEAAVREGVKPTLAFRAIISAPTELSRKGVDTEKLEAGDYLTVLRAVESGRVAKEAIPEILGATASGMPAEQAITTVGSSVTPGELTRIIRRILEERKDFVREKKMAALGPLMGVVMQEVRGKVDGRLVSEALRRELERSSREKSRE